MMTDKSAGCPKCNGTMEVGFILEGGEGRFVSEWVEGAPEFSFWTGLKTSNRRKLEVTTYRCARCGYLESYALKAPD
jgi:predicted nucleic-acid-binding Zn-ribbon protein